MRKQLLLGILALLLLLAVPLAGRQPGTTVTTTATVTATATTTATTTTTATATVTDTAALDALQQKLDAANAELDTLRLQGETAADTVARVARYYNQTHTYSTTDMFVCGDMAAEIYNMLKTLGINSLMVVGAVNAPITDILQSNHAWLLAEVEPNTYLAVECTGGYVVPESQNALYYRGWYYSNPETLKQYFDDVKEYNTRVDMINDVVAEDQTVVAQYNQNGSPSLLAVHNELTKIIENWRSYMDQLIVNINSAATPLTIG
jgi:hypothetical protein